MSYPNSGSISKNDKGDNPKRPDYKGAAEVDGVQYWIAAWVKDGTDGKFLSLSFDPKEKKEDKPQQEKNTTPPDEDIPF